MSRVLFATNADHPDLTADDRLAAAAVERAGIRVEPGVWSRTDPAALSGVDAVVIRSCWDYHLVPQDFDAWLEGVERAGIPAVNPVSLLRWNLHKRYLLDLERQGVAIVPTRLIPRGAVGVTLADLLDLANWDEAVVKPAVSLSAHETWRTTRGQARVHEARFAALLRAGDVLLQRFVPEVMDGGEWSLVFLGGQFSHAVVKRPRAGDFRVQQDHGGSVEAAAAPPGVLAEAARVVGALPVAPAYARIDGVEVAGRLLLMEAECIDPVLYFGMQSEAVERFAALLAARVGGARVRVSIPPT